MNTCTDLERLQQWLIERPGLERWEYDLLEADGERKLADGWKLDDVIAYQRCTEHVTPSLGEDVALARMRVMAAKYGS